MRQLRYSVSAKRDIAEIYKYISRRSKSQTPAKQFVDALRSRCRDLSLLDGQMGRPRPELLDDLRSRAYGNYIIYFRYRDNELEIIRIIEAHREVDPEDIVGEV